MKVALYIRVSTLDQNPDAQRRELEAYANRHKWEIVEVFEEHASGATWKQSALVKLLETARTGEFETVLVWKLDRFGRSLIDLLANLQVLESERVRFIAVSQGIDTGEDYRNPTTQFFLHVLAAVAEFERSLIMERVQAGRKRYLEDLRAGRVGKTVHTRSGKDLPPWRPRRVIDLQKLRSLRAEGKGWTEIANILGVPRSTAMKRFFESEPEPEWPDWIRALSRAAIKSGSESATSPADTKVNSTEQTDN